MRIAVAARKGGVGKSSIVAGLASLMADAGHHVLAIDLDPQSNLAFMLGGDPTAPGTAALLGGEHPKPIEVSERLDVLPGGPDLARQDIARLDPEDLAYTIQAYDHDIILFDSPPGSEHLERLGIVASDCAIVVTNAHPIAVIGATRVLEDLKIRQARGRKGPSRWSVVTNMIDARRSLDRNMEALLGDSAFGLPLFSVKQDTNLAMATAQGVPLAKFAPSCPSAKALQHIAGWCLA